MIAQNLCVPTSESWGLAEQPLSYKVAAPNFALIPTARPFYTTKSSCTESVWTQAALGGLSMTGTLRQAVALSVSFK
eukprot:1189221-Rhodomonas_salina.4